MSPHHHRSRGVGRPLWLQLPYRLRTTPKPANGAAAPIKSTEGAAHNPANGAASPLKFFERAAPNLVYGAAAPIKSFADRIWIDQLTP
jgi:hypothetical protein